MSFTPIRTVAGRTPKPVPGFPRAQLVAHLKQEPCESSVALCFLLMARRVTIGVKAYPHAAKPETWCFRFERNAVLEIDGDGTSKWIAGSDKLKRLINVVIDCARERFAEMQATHTGCGGRSTRC